MPDSKLATLLICYGISPLGRESRAFPDKLSSPLGTVQVARKLQTWERGTSESSLCEDYSQVHTQLVGGTI